jgi:hypothetical protein
MSLFFNNPVLVLVVSFLGFWMSASLGSRFRARARNGGEETAKDYSLTLGGTLTLLGLITGFTFSMAVSRYDQRKTLEEEETNAIGTEYVRADLLPAVDAVKVRGLLLSYLMDRIRYYEARDTQDLQQIENQTARLQAELWSAVATPALAQPTPLAALAVSGMNDVLNSQGYSQAAWRNRIPAGAWVLLIAIAIFCNALIGYASTERSALSHLILPTALSITFFLIADIDSPRGGVIRVHPQNLQSTAASLAPR